jgi:hypothetical protein
MNVDFSNEIALVGLQYVPERFHTYAMSKLAVMDFL